MFSIPPDTLSQKILLNGLQGIGPVTVRRLREAFNQDLAAALRANPGQLRQVKGLNEAMIQSLTQRNFDWATEKLSAEQKGFKIISNEATEWPGALEHLWDPPLVLYTEGSSPPTARSVAIIGSRHCTPYGTQLAHHFARDLAKLGWCIISGLARGIDCAAHEGALASNGHTVAVLGHGIDQTYPPEAIKLRRRITERGSILSEFPLGRSADRQSFPQRNRIVAGLAQAVIVIETDNDGGSMITARFASDLGKTLCVVPGRVDSTHSRGCHALIRDGATLVTSVDDILAELGEARGQLLIPLEQIPPEEAKWLYHFRGGTIHDAESLAEVALSPLADAASALTLLEIQGRLIRRTDGRHERG